MGGSFTPVDQEARSLHLRMVNQPEFMRVPIVSGESWADFKERTYKAYYTVKGLNDDAISAMVGDTILFLVPANVDEPEDPAIATAVSVEANRLRGGKKLGSEHFGCYVVATGAGSGAGGAAAASKDDVVLQLLAEQKLMREALDAMKVAQDRKDFERLFIEPVRHTSGSWASVRSPKDDERFDLKVATVTHYGLWKFREGDDHNLWTVYPMLSDAAYVDGKPVALPFKEVILAHVWPSKSGNPETHDVASLLGLPHTFAVEPRNFLLLPKFFESAFDCDSMLLLPRSRAPPAVSARAHQVDLLPAHERQRLSAFCSTAPTLYLPLASEGGLPFLRVLGWKGLSAIRARALHEAEALAGVPEFFDADVSLDGDGQPPLKKAMTRAASLGVRYRALGGGVGGP